MTVNVDYCSLCIFHRKLDVSNVSISSPVTKIILFAGFRMFAAHQRFPVLYFTTPPLYLDIYSYPRDRDFEQRVALCVYGKSDLHLNPDFIASYYMLHLQLRARYSFDASDSCNWLRRIITVRIKIIMLTVSLLIKRKKRISNESVPRA